MTLTREQVSAWLRERMDNCHRLASQKRGADKMGWLEDAAYLNATIAHLDSRPGWIPVGADTLPEGGRVIVCDTNSYVRDEWAEHVRYLYSCAIKEGDICHYAYWQPLPPAPPKQEVSR